MFRTAKIPIPSRESLPKIDPEQLDDSYQRVVFDSEGNSFRSDFVSEDEKIAEIANEQANLVYEERIPETESIANEQATSVVFNKQYKLPAQYSEGLTANSLTFNSAVRFNGGSFNPDSTVTYSSSTGEFSLPPGYAYKLKAQVTARSEAENYAGVEFTWYIDNVPVGNVGVCRSFDKSGQSGDDYCDITVVDGVAHYLNNGQSNVTAKVVVTNLMLNTVTTNGFSLAEIEIIKDLTND